MYKAILKHVFDNFLFFFYNVLDMQKALSISARVQKWPISPYWFRAQKIKFFFIELRKKTLILTIKQ
jgi:hypothetical protein